MRDKWRGSKGVGTHIDYSVVTLADRRKVVEDALDAELAKPSSNPVEVIRLHRQLDKGDF